MARTHTFKGSASAGYGYFAYIEDGQLVIGEDWGRDGGILYKGPYAHVDTHTMRLLENNALKLYESILRYYAKEDAAKEVANITHWFKDSRDFRQGCGHYGYIENGELVLCMDLPREGGVYFRGSYNEAVATNYLIRIKKEDRVLYDDIEKYFTKHGVSDESDKRATHSTGDERATAVGYCSEGDPRQKAVGYYCDDSYHTRSSSDPKKKETSGYKATTIPFKVKLMMNNGKELDAVIPGTSETDVIRKIMLPVPDTVMMYDLEGRTMAVRSDKIYTVAIIE